MTDEYGIEAAGHKCKQIENGYEYNTLMRLLGVSVSKHLLDKHFTCIWANDYFYDLIGYSKAEFEELFHNRPDEYFHNNTSSLRKLVRSVRESLDKGEKGNTVYLPLIRPNGKSFWVKLQAAFTEEYSSGYQIAYTTLTDVTQMVESRREQEQARLEQEKTRQDLEQIIHEQEMLMSILKVSVSKHIFDEHFTCVWANEYYYKLIGYPKERYEALFHNHPDEYYGNNPEGWEMLTKTVSRVLEEGGNQYDIIAPMKYEDGSSFWVKLSSYFTDEYIDGYRSTYTVMTDVTELVQMKNEQEMLMQAMKVSVSRHLVDEHFTVVWANEFYYQLIGYTKSDYEAQFHNHCDEYFKGREGSWEKIHEKIQDMYGAGEKSYELFLPLKIPDGSTRWVKMVGFFTEEYQDGRQLAYTTMVDVTDLMQIQQEKAVAYENIPGFIVKHRILPDRIVMVDASERINDMFDLDMSRLETFDVYAWLQPESRAIIEASHSRLRRGEPFDETICLKDKYHKERWFRIHSTCIDFIASDPVYLTVFIDVTDITELRELKRELEERTDMLNTALKAAERANRAKSDFLSRMSHDIRTPMNAILGMTAIASSHVHDPERIRDCLDKITVSSKLLLSLINEVLDMSKIESGRLVLAEEEVNLGELVQGVVTMVQPEINHKDLVFKTYVNSVAHEIVISDMQRLQQILLNLLSNAVKYTPKGGKIRLEINERPSEQPHKAFYQFVISDTGIGMKPDFLNRVFDPFERAEDTRIQSVQGTGLGLSICRSIAELMGGTIEVNSTYEVGSRFTVTVCLQIQEEPLDESTFAGLRILIADDDETVCRNTCDRLKELGIAAEWVTNGRAAIEKIELAQANGTDYFTAILDYRMPGMDGIETARRIREKAGAEFPIIMISAYDLSEQMDVARLAGANGFITKPLFRSRLEFKLKQLMDGKSRMPEPFPLLTGSYEDKRILLVEDNELNREIAVELLTSTGAAVDTAQNGKEAVAMVEKALPGTYHLVFMDMQMPVMDGCTAAKEIRKLSREDVKSLPIIAMTANAFADDRKKTREAGMNGHLAKPVDIEQLGQILRKWL